MTLLCEAKNLMCQAHVRVGKTKCGVEEACQLKLEGGNCGEESVKKQRKPTEYVTNKVQSLGGDPRR